MQTTSFPPVRPAAVLATTVRFQPPAHVKRWTGRASLTIPLPSLAALRIAAIDLAKPARA